MGTMAGSSDTMGEARCLPMLGSEAGDAGVECTITGEGAVLGEEDIRLDGLCRAGELRER